jgi:hypothetical protein
LAATASELAEKVTKVSIAMEKSALPWKSGPSGPRKLFKSPRALAPVVVITRQPHFSARFSAMPHKAHQTGL